MRSSLSQKSQWRRARVLVAESQSSAQSSVVKVQHCRAWSPNGWVTITCGFALALRFLRVVHACLCDYCCQCYSHNFTVKHSGSPPYVEEGRYGKPLHYYSFSIHLRRVSKLASTSHLVRKVFPRPHFFGARTQSSLRKHIFITGPKSKTFELVSRLYCSW